MSRPPLKPGEVRIEQCQECGEYHLPGQCKPTNNAPAGEVKTELPLFDGTAPLPFINGYRFRTPDGRTGTMKHVDATYTLDGELVRGTAMVVVLDR